MLTCIWPASFGRYVTKLMTVACISLFESCQYTANVYVTVIFISIYVVVFIHSSLFTVVLCFSFCLFFVSTCY